MNTDEQDATLFADDFAGYPPCERMDRDYLRGLKTNAKQRRYDGHVQGIGPWTQTTLHYRWHSERMGSRHECSLPWQITEQDGKHWLTQPERFFNAVLVAGDHAWQDYVLELDIAVADGPAGPLVRYHTSRQNYWLAIEADEPLRLFRRDQNEQILLAIAESARPARDKVHHVRVTCDGARIEVAFDGRPVICVRDDSQPRGRIALRTEGPARFGAVRVLPLEGEPERLRAHETRRAARLAARRKKLPAAKLLHEIDLPADTTVVHMRDVNDDGQLELVACEVAVPKADYMRLARISVLDWNGKPLWTMGESLAGKLHVHGGFAFNTADIDGDGHTEILVTRNFEILIIDGATGRIKKRAPTPQAFKGREDNFPQTVGDSILVCNLRGLDGPRDFVLKDRYRNLWAYTCELEPLWHCHVNTGHYPRARDVDGDGKDEIMAGYTLLAADAAPLWTVPGGEPWHNSYPGSEHMDSVLIERFDTNPNGGPLQIAMAASDLGFVLLDVRGNVLAHHRVGHAQALGAARFRPDLPGRQFAIRTAWGNFHIMNLFDTDGNLLLTRELLDGNVLPVNWLGDGSALFRFSRALADGNFEPVVEIPGGGSLFPAAYDVNNDGVDELMVRRRGTVGVYGPESVPPNPAPPPVRNLTNWNNYGGFYV